MAVCPGATVADVEEPDPREIEKSAPVPVRGSVCGLPWALSVTVKVAVLVPDAVGVKLTVILQAPPAARMEPQLLVWVKSPSPGPAIAMLVMLSAALVAFDSVTV